MILEIPFNFVVSMIFMTAPVLIPDYIRLYAATMSLYCLPEDRIAF